MVLIRRWLFLPVLLLAGLPARAASIDPDIASICDAASAAAASARGIPADALYAITLTETGRSSGGRRHRPGRGRRRGR